ncbi:MAG: metallophosphoesterase family protein [Anaerolineales bacterium]|nr:metallophosphoesterase family protein [Anaerolineales bacterium]
MSKDITKVKKVISTALDAAFHRALEQEQAEGELVLNINDQRFIVFSDQHKGARDGADDFMVCERTYNAALTYYDQQGYTLAVLGDVEELWEETAPTVLKAYSQTLNLEGKFHKDGRYLRVWGNHDDAWSHKDLVDRWLEPALGGDLRVRESLILHVRDGQEELGRLFLLHGHQGTFDGEYIASLAKFVLRYIWRPIQRLFKISLNTPAKDFELRYALESALYAWSEQQRKVVLIAGHTHHPVFKSESKEEFMRASPAEAEAKPVSPTMLAIEFKKPSYFNTGCCAYLNGDITGLEFSDGEIRLVRWPDDEDRPKPKVLAKAKLEEVFAAC